MTSRYFYNVTAQLVTFAVLVVLGLAFWQFAVRDEGEIQSDSARRIDDEQLALRRMEAQVSDIDNIYDHYHANHEEVRFFQEHYLRQKAQRVRRISAFLEEVARKRGVSLEEVRYGSGPSRGRDLEMYTMDLPLTGRYRDIRLLIGDIEASDMFLVIAKLTLEDVSGREGAVRVQLSLATFFEGRGT